MKFESQEQTGLVLLYLHFEKLWSSSSRYGVEGDLFDVYSQPAARRDFVVKFSILFLATCRTLRPLSHASFNVVNNNV